MLNIVLVEPEIPQNTGNIARTCAATGIRLHLVEPMGFKIDDKQVKRAGLDYWDLLDVHKYDDLDDFFAKNKEGKFFYATTKAENTYADVSYKTDEEIYILFGKETKGLDEELLIKNPERCIRIPMVSDARSLNLSNAAAIICYEALRQRDFGDLLKVGPFPNQNK